MSQMICHMATVPVAAFADTGPGSAQTRAAVQAVRTATAALLQKQDPPLVLVERDICVSHRDNGAPYIKEYPHIMVSVTHTSDHAYAMVCSTGNTDAG